MYGSDILRGISKVPFEIPHKISDPYIERYDFYTTSKFSELLDLRAHTRYWNAPPDHQMSCSELTRMRGYQYSSPNNGLQATYPLYGIHNWIPLTVTMSVLISLETSVLYHHFNLSGDEIQILWETQYTAMMLMPWLLVSPCHQQPLYWLHRLNRSLSFMKQHFNYQHVLSVQKW